MFRNDVYGFIVKSKKELIFECAQDEAYEHRWLLIPMVRC